MNPALLGAVQFQCGGHGCALRFSQVGEVVPMGTLAKLPAMPPLLRGFLLLGRDPWPVLPLARLLGRVPAPETSETMLLLARTGGSRLALQVDRVTGILRFSPDDLLPVAAEDSLNGLCEGLLSTPSGSVALLEVGRLLHQREQVLLTQWQSAMEERLVLLDSPASPAA